MFENYFTENHNIFRKSVRDFVLKELAPHAEEWEKAEEFPREVYKRMGELGFLGIRMPEKYGGSGLDYWYTVCFAEELPLSRMAGLNMSIMVQTDMATPVIAEIGTEEQCREFLVPAIQGEKIAALGVTEPGAGSDVANIKTTAKKVGGDYVINGAKTFITNGTRADFITLAVRTGGEGYGGISLVLFPTDTKGFSVGRKLKKLGNKTSDTAELFFDNCKIPARYLLGEENHGFYYIMNNFQGERLIGAVAGIAGCQYMWQDAYNYSMERHAFGKPIGKFQVWRHRLVDLLTQIEAGRMLTYHACDLFNRKINCVKEISMAKLYAAELAIKVANECLQIHGGYGYMDEYDISRAYRDVRLLAIGGGTSEIMKEIIGKLIGL
jgi:citronellyl-CoA dehydrogenase